MLVTNRMLSNVYQNYDLPIYNSKVSTLADTSDNVEYIFSSSKSYQIKNYRDMISIKDTQKEITDLQTTENLLHTIEDKITKASTDSNGNFENYIKNLKTRLSSLLKDFNPDSLEVFKKILEIKPNTITVTSAAQLPQNIGEVKNLDFLIGKFSINFQFEKISDNFIKITSKYKSMALGSRIISTPVFNTTKSNENVIVSRTENVGNNVAKSMINFVEQIQNKIEKQKELLNNNLEIKLNDFYETNTTDLSQNNTKLHSFASNDMLEAQSNINAFTVLELLK